MQSSDLGDPTALVDARNMAHAAAQFLYKAAVANIPKAPGDSHSNLTWASGRFQTNPLSDDGTVLTLSISPLALAIGDKSLTLDGVAASAALDWVDSALGAHGLKPASSVELRYDLPVAVTELTEYTAIPGLAEVAAWFELAASTLEEFAAGASDLSPGPSPVRCWPDPFDIATYVSLETGDPETARGIGVGLSPGDTSNEQPYFYINPWPHLSLDQVPAAIEPGYWHTEGYVGSVGTGEAIVGTADPIGGTKAFVQGSFDAGRVALGL